MIDEELLRILACPKCKGELTFLKEEPNLPEGEGLLCLKCKLVYPIRDDIPIMLIDSAIPFEEEKDGQSACDSRS